MVFMRKGLGFHLDVVVSLICYKGKGERLLGTSADFGLIMELGRLLNIHNYVINKKRFQ